MDKEIASKTPNGGPERTSFTISLPDIGLGTMRTSATYAAALIQLEGRRCEQIDVLDSVMAALGISPEEILHNRKRPDCVEEDAYAEWADEMARLETLNSANRKGDGRR